MSISVFLREALSNLKLAKHVYNLIRSWNSPKQWKTSFRSKKSILFLRTSIFTLQYDAVMLNVSNNPCNQYQAYKAWEVLYQILLESLLIYLHDKYFTNNIFCILFSHNWVQLTVLEAPNDHLCYARWTSTKCNPTETGFSSYELICILPGDSDNCSFFSSLVW